ncbi:peptide deformylase [Thermosporothrix hazakensis]|jgi:peptide deformylase|uniref:Peptide deformylase n=1 Tax=Thermosporothrix hazakensis TaxID=644383 RepID=A0A326U268_THEHA|nr:peptide deformylase [Thermosporothrix hazakensis]PZW24077.1 peptide deformylase [Thermosporothrix hazakensis]GCE50290.1 peptide deformylase [Thermosporothrix hazakensis]
MAIRNVLQLGDPGLRVVSEPVADPGAPEIAALLTDLQDTLTHWRTTTTYGRGIAAPQIGVPLRVIFLHLEQPWPLINPTIIAHSEEQMVVWDACLSFLCIFCQVWRYQQVDVRYQDLQGAWHTVHAEGDLAELLQHEIDHLDGILALDRMTDIRTMCTREEFEKRYRERSPYAR